MKRVFLLQEKVLGDNFQDDDAESENVESVVRVLAGRVARECDSILSEYDLIARTRRVVRRVDESKSASDLPVQTRSPPIPRINCVVFQGDGRQSRRRRRRRRRRSTAINRRATSLPCDRISFVVNSTIITVIAHFWDDANGCEKVTVTETRVSTRCHVQKLRRSTLGGAIEDGVRDADLADQTPRRGVDSQRVFVAENRNRRYAIDGDRTLLFKVAQNAHSSRIEGDVVND